jgi:hypothetical protein
MSTFIILSRISPEAFSDPFEFKKIAERVASKIKSELRAGSTSWILSSLMIQRKSRKQL